MSVIDYIAGIVRKAGIDHADPASSLRQGWDFWIPGKAHTDGDGVARAPHRWMFNEQKLPDGHRPIFIPDMSARQLLGGIWRQILIRPGETADEAVDDPFAVENCTACTRTDRLVALLGHPPCDLALYLDHLRNTDPELFKLILAKDFKAALSLRPTAIDAPWPHSVQRNFDKKRKDYLPPFLVAVLYAELARLANNQAGLLALSFDQGIYLSTAQFLDRLPLAGGIYAPHAIKRLVEMSNFQTSAFTRRPFPSERNPATAAAHHDMMAGQLTLAIGLCSLNMPISYPNSPHEARDGIQTHPAFGKEWRAKRGESRQFRPSATYWSLNWTRHASIGLLEIMTVARIWNERHRPNGPRLAAISRRRRAQSMAAISFGWLAESDPLAALAQLQSMDKDKEEGKGKDENEEEGKNENKVPKWTIDQIEPLVVETVLGEKSGGTLLATAEREVHTRPAPGEFGYTARYQAHLWLDDTGTDFDRYHCLCLQAEHAIRLSTIPDIRRLQTAGSRIPDNVVAHLGRMHRIASQANHHSALSRSPETIDPGIVKIAQNLGMTISPLSLDPMLEFLLRNRSK